jgi:fumarate reductase subunit C
MSLRGQAVLWATQRTSGAVLGLCTVIHLGTIIYAVRHGLSAADILARTRGNLVWAGFYATFVIAVALHAPLGLRIILVEWLGWRDCASALASAVLAIVFVMAGMRAVIGVLA